MPKVCAHIVGHESIAKTSRGQNRPLGDHAHAVHVGRGLLFDAMPMNAGHSMRSWRVVQRDHDRVALAHLDRRARHEFVHDVDRFEHAVAQNAVLSQTIGVVVWAVEARSAQSCVRLECPVVFAYHW